MRDSYAPGKADLAQANLGLAQAGKPVSCTANEFFTTMDQFNQIYYRLAEFKGRLLGHAPTVGESDPIPPTGMIGEMEARLSDVRGKIGDMDDMLTALERRIFG